MSGLSEREMDLRLRELNALEHHAAVDEHIRQLSSESRYSKMLPFLRHYCELRFGAFHGNILPSD
jgi:hypothetical protein